jgi:hypothetical protein
VLRYDWRDTALITVHNFTDSAQTFDLDVDGRDDRAGGAESIARERGARRW